MSKGFYISIMKTLTGILLFVTIVATGAISQFNETLAYDRINQYRVEAKVSNVVVDRHLQSNAYDWAQAMVTLNETRHDINFAMGSFSGECIAFLAQDYTEDKVIELFYNSYEHRKIMLNPRWTSVGIAKVETRGGYYVCLRFN